MSKSSFEILVNPIWDRGTVASLGKFLERTPESKLFSSYLLILTVWQSFFTIKGRILRIPCEKYMENSKRSILQEPHHAIKEW